MTGWIAEFFYTLFSGMALFIPIITGPIAAAVYVTIGKRPNRWLFILFWLLIIIANAMSLPLMACTWGHCYPDSGFFALHTFPLTATVSFAIFLLTLIKSWQFLKASKSSRAWYVVGMILIPSIQVAIPEFYNHVPSTIRYLIPMLGFSC